ncbi:unnamed protein product, partial [Menidia menidia]
TGDNAEGCPSSPTAGGMNPSALLFRLRHTAEHPPAPEAGPLTGARLSVGSALLSGVKNAAPRGLCVTAVLSNAPQVFAESKNTAKQEEKRNGGRLGDDSRDVINKIPHSSEPKRAILPRALVRTGKANGRGRRKRGRGWQIVGNAPQQDSQSSHRRPASHGHGRVRLLKRTLLNPSENTDPYAAVVVLLQELPVQWMSWSVGLGGRMTAAKLLLPFFILHFCEGSNQPPRFLNYFFSTYLLIYEDMPIDVHMEVAFQFLNTVTSTQASKRELNHLMRSLSRCVAAMSGSILHKPRRYLAFKTASLEAQNSKLFVSAIILSTHPFSSPALTCFAPRDMQEPGKKFGGPAWERQSGKRRERQAAKPEVSIRTVRKEQGLEAGKKEMWAGGRRRVPSLTDGLTCWGAVWRFGTDAPPKDSRDRRRGNMSGTALTHHPTDCITSAPSLTGPAQVCPSSSSVAQLKATDPEGEPLIYGVSGEEAMRYFSVNRDTGVVWLRQQLDRESKSEMQVEFYVSDIQEVVKDTVNIQIGDVNDNAPNFHGQPYTVHIPEFWFYTPTPHLVPHLAANKVNRSVVCPQNTPVGRSIFMVNATDPDQGTGGSVLFSFQPPSPFFAIDGARGTVTVIRPLDYERTSAYQLTVNATDQDKVRPLSRLANLAITITDVQDMDPIFTNLPYSTNIEEDVPQGYEVRKITAIDQDLGRPRGIGYTIISVLSAALRDAPLAFPLLAPSVLRGSAARSCGTRLISSGKTYNAFAPSHRKEVTQVWRHHFLPGQGNTNSVFALDYISGSLTVNGQLDRENPLYSAGFTLTVKATELKDDRSPSDATVMTTFTILLIDKNDNAPKFNSSEYRVLITELAQVGFALPLFIQAEDKDEGVNSMFQVFLTGNNSEFFTISPTAVQGRADIRMRVAKPLDFENIRSYSFSLYANESMSDHVGFARVFIELINENDNRPIFSRPLYNISLPESTPPGTSLLRILATDGDAGTFGIVRYYFSDEPDQFSLDDETGWVILQASLDYELMRRFTLTVLARDGGGEETTGRIRVNVLDVNDNAPLFQKEAYVGSLQENEQTVQSVARIRATDEDSPPNNVLTYTITSASAFRDYFSIVMVEGYAVISVARPLDYERVPNGMIYLTVMAKDGGNPALNSTVPITVEVIDENDNPPEFSKQSYIVKIPENIIAGATVLLVNATDLDASREFGQASLIYSLEGASQFRLNSRSGEITTTALLDREQKSEYILIVRAVDGGVGPQQKTGIATVNITILDINDNAPIWQDEPYHANVVEMSPINTDVISVLAYDPDNGQNGTVVYSISPENPFYTIDGRTGKIRTSGVTLDRESSNSRDTTLMRTIIISAVDRGTPPQRASASTTVFVNLLDLNDNDPTFLNLPFVAEVPEGMSVGTSFFRVQVEDPDEDKNGLITMALQMGMPRLDFYLNTSTGVLTSTAVLDREQMGQYHLRIVAFDAGEFPRTSTSTLTITVLDVNDETPTFNPRLYNVSLKESVPRDHVVARLSCSDNDAGLNAELSYFITDGNQDGKFSVGFRDGVVKTVVSLDRETQAAYTLVVEAIDNGPAGSRRTGTATVFVEVQDVNDNRPIFLQNSYETSILETAPQGTSILKVQATDADQGENGRVLYRILTGNSNNLFSIDRGTGLVTRGLRALDRETSSSHVLEVEAYNSDEGSMRSSVRVIIYVDDANDEVPVFTQQQYNRLGLRETAGIGTSVIVVRATDPDTGDGGAVAYALMSGSDRKFEVDVSTGLVTTVDYLDYETKTTYLMNVSATDQAPPFHQGFCTVYVTLLNELDEAVAFFSAGYEASLRENIATGTEVVQVRAQSADNLNQLTYRFDPDTSPVALALFKIDSVTGRITVTGLLDREKGDFYTLTVVADDGGPKKDSTVVSITILDENDNSPEFDITSDTSVSVVENTAMGKKVAVVLGRDRDAGSNGLVNFTLAAGNMEDVFKIKTVNNSYGEVYVNAPLDRESVDRYLLKVRATDNGSPPRHTDHSLTINILDVNDNAPVIENQRGYNVSVNENVGGGTSVLRMMATDKDIGPNAMLFYYITAGNQDLTFRMDRVTGEMVTRPAPPDRERQQEYRLTVTVEDDGTPPLSNFCNLLNLPLVSTIAEAHKWNSLVQPAMAPWTASGGIRIKMPSFSFLLSRQCTDNNPGRGYCETVHEDKKALRTERRGRDSRLLDQRVRFCCSLNLQEVKKKHMWVMTHTATRLQPKYDSPCKMSNGNRDSKCTHSIS